MTTLLRNLQEHVALMNELPALDGPVELAGAAIARCLQAGGKLLLCGNGGSAADCQHIAAELTGRFIKDRRPLAAIALTTDSSALTCIGNDYAFDDVFVRPLQALGRAGDCLLAISTSGNSGNVIKAVQAAREAGITSIGLLGRDGGKLAALCDQSIVVPGSATARIQEAHILIGHTLCNIIESALGLD
jgi:D-sedoheptulose 7-phosphate isomerase